jgi:ATP-dependent Clp protease ATP-binding subunit ClpA
VQNTPVKPKKEKVPAKKRAPRTGQSQDAGFQSRTSKRTGGGKETKKPAPEPEAPKAATVQADVAEKPAARKPSTAVPKVPRKKIGFVAKR